MNRLGVRLEDKSPFERRVAVTPELAGALVGGGVEVVVQASPNRCIADGRYSAAGARVAPDIEDAGVVIGVKEIPIQFLRPGRAYLYFSHTIKGQPYNMPMLAHVLRSGCTLMDHELIANEKGQRLVFFGRFAGYAGAVETLAALGSKLGARGVRTPLADLKQPMAYADLEAAKVALRRAGEAIAREGVPDGLHPLTIGLLGYGQVGQGVRVMLDALGVKWISPEEMATLDATASRHAVYAAEYREQHMVERSDGGAFALQEFYDHPERYASIVHRHLPRWTVLVNTIFWTPKYPVYVPNELLRTLESEGRLRLLVIGDITCDIDGSIQATNKPTDPGDPCYTYRPSRGTWTDGITADGVTVMAVDILPCEFPLEASQTFATALGPFLRPLCEARLDAADPESSGLPPELVRAVIAWRGKLVPKWAHLKDAVARHGG